MSHNKPQSVFYPITGYKDYYINKETSEVLFLGDDLPKILKQTPNSNTQDNYFVVQLNDGKNHFVHRLMAKTFLPKPEKEHVNHKDGNKQNNSLSNLEWATPSENAQHAFDTGLTTVITKSVYQYTLSGDYIQAFDSDVEASKATKVLKQNISKCTLGKRPHAGGYQWRRVRLPKIAPCEVRVIKCIEITEPNGDTRKVYPKGQNIVGITAETLGVGKHILTRRFKESDVIFVGDKKVEKIYYE